MRILLTGAAGQLGRELTPLLAERGELTTTDIDDSVTRVDRRVDITDERQLRLLLESVNPQLIVNTAADTAVDAAEKHPARARALNAGMPQRLAAWCRQNRGLLVHFSTDYVFDGSKDSPYREDDEPSPISIYGVTKRGGEHAVLTGGCRHVLLRTSWVYSSHGRNFVRRMLELGRERRRLSVVNDQRGCPTWAHNLAEVTVKLIDEAGADGSPGLLHYCDRDALTWYEFAVMIFERAEKRGLIERAPELVPVESSAFQAPAARPSNSVLDTSTIKERYGVQPRSLTESLDACFEELEANE